MTKALTYENFRCYFCKHLITVGGYTTHTCNKNHYIEFNNGCNECGKPYREDIDICEDYIYDYEKFHDSPYD